MIFVKETNIRYATSDGEYMAVGAIEPAFYRWAKFEALSDDSLIKFLEIC